MTYRVVVSPLAAERLADAALWYAEASASNDLAREWHAGFLETLATLRDNPDQCPIASESDALPFQVRELYYGKGRKKTHRGPVSDSGECG